MNAVIYARYSSDNQREESIEGQLRECMEFAERSGLTVVATYIDRALSAKTDDRPDFQRMIKDSAKGLFQVIIVWKLDRFSRNRYDSAYYKMMLKKNGVRLVSAKENISDGPEGIILESMLEGIAEFYSAELSVKVLRGLTENALKGKYNGGGMPWGYRADEDQYYQLDENVAPLAREVFVRYADGQRMKDIIDWLNGLGAKTQRGKPFNYSSIYAILKNRRYIGEYQYRDVVLPGAIPAIVESELFARVQQRMERNRKAPAKGKAEIEYILTTKLFCGECGTMMVGESGKGRNGVVHHYYKCSKAKRNKGCKKRAVKKDWIENIVVYRTVDYVLTDAMIGRIADAIMASQQQENAALRLLRAQKAEVEKALNNMLKAIEQGVITNSTKRRLEELEQEQEQLAQNILREELSGSTLTREQIVFWLSQFQGGDPNDADYRKRIVDYFVNAVYVYDDRLVLTYNCKDGEESVSLAEIETALGSDLVECAPPHCANKKDAAGQKTCCIGTSKAKIGLIAE